MVLPANLANNDIINEAWVDAVVAELTDLAAPSSRYPAKPSAGVVYGINQYEQALGTTTDVPQSIAATFVTIAMPAAPAGSLLSLSMTCYVNSTVGHGGGFMWFRVNGAVVGAAVVITDETALRTYSGRAVNIAQPVGIAYNIELTAAKNAAGGVLKLVTTNTHLSVVSYRP